VEFDMQFWFVDTAMGVNVDALHGGQSEYVSAILCIKDCQQCYRCVSKIHWRG